MAECLACHGFGTVARNDKKPGRWKCHACDGKGEVSSAPDRRPSLGDRAPNPDDLGRGVFNPYDGEFDD